jgi:lysophospholipase L1-like esterase
MIKRFAIAAALMTATPVMAATPPEPVHVVLVGDSLMQAASGYGGALCARFRPEAKCDNLGRGGASSKSYRDIGAWDTAVKTFSEPGFKETYVLIQLGTNDGSSLPARHTELPEFKANIGKFVDEVRAAGAIPVLITVLTDRNFKDGKLGLGYKPWADQVTALATEKNVPLIDLYARSQVAIQAIGPVGALELGRVPAPERYYEAAKTGNMPGRQAPPARPDVPIAAPGAAPAPAPSPAAARPPVAATPGAAPAAPAVQFDTLHIGAKGAALVSGLVAQDIKTKVPGLAAYVATTQ